MNYDLTYSICDFLFAYINVFLSNAKSHMLSPSCFALVLCYAGDPETPPPPVLGLSSDTPDTEPVTSAAADESSNGIL